MASRSQSAERSVKDVVMASIQPELWVEHADRALTFYRKAFGARVLHRVGEGEDIVAQLAVGDVSFWIASAAPEMGRFSPKEISGSTGRTLLVVDNPEAVVQAAVGEGAVVKSEVRDEHGWRVGRIIDPFGHEWEIGKPIADWPPT